MRGTLPSFAFFAIFCHIGCPLPLGTVSSQRDRIANPDARDQRGYQGLWVKAWADKIPTKPNPGGPPEMAEFANVCILTPRGDPTAPRCQGICGNPVA